MIAAALTMVLFIFIGAIGIASLQDAWAPIKRHMAPQLQSIMQFLSALQHKTVGTIKYSK